MPRRLRAPAAVAAAGAVTVVVVLGLATGGGGAGSQPEAQPDPATTTTAPAGTTTTTALAPAPLRDPFCPLVDAATGAPQSCPVRQPPAAAGPEPATVRLLDVFVDGGQPHASVAVGPTTFVLHQGDAFGASYRLVSMSGVCAVVAGRDGEVSLCEGQEARL